MSEAAHAAKNSAGICYPVHDLRTRQSEAGFGLQIMDEIEGKYRT
jgi:hypothetical protein